ncbi:LLM class flavin-dependent oxidoreductase [Catenuloplanes atrovinosus]|uniref:Alkanesulfonate monooxygenase n=1 Tax=Catenuloplanes atrovinosus TaxID=137266 RepID=A0AAE3YKQ7_9ACTN|nr:LLM class flavin-dependent oxidoreductase [Catenuloplanes atrovinosus]MDR7275599.1 alkanesulfonate monooxygenase [Catenuloplanes atrovinosus]
MTGSPFTVYTTCPASTVDSPKQYLTRLRDVSRWTEAAGCRGFLVYADNSLTDVWLTAQTVIERTDTLVPMVAVQPVYTHPYAVAKAVASLAWLHERQVDLNLITGGFAKHLAELGDPLREDHDGRYRRLREFALIIRDLLSTQSPTIFHGDHYRVDKATFHPPLPPALAPRLFVSGNSPASREVTDSLDATRLTYPAHPDDVGNAWRESAHAVGIRIGIIARETSAEAWKTAVSRFPADPAGRRMHRLAQRLSDSKWHAALSDDARSTEPSADTYWLHPFRTYKTFCPYLVGSYAEVTRLVAAYRDMGAETIILDVPDTEDDLHHAMTVLRGVGAAHSDASSAR